VSGVHPIEHLRFVARARGVDATALVEECLAALEYLCRQQNGPSNDVVVACRRLVERHRAIAPLWWACSHVLVAHDTRGAARAAVDRLRLDETSSRLSTAFPSDATVVAVGPADTIADAVERRDDVAVRVVDGGHGAGAVVRRLERSGIRCDPVDVESIAPAVKTADVVLVEAIAVAPGRVLAEPGSHVVAAFAASVGTPVWLVVPTGRRLHRAHVDRIGTALGGDRGVVGTESTVRPAEFDDLPVDLIARTVDARGTHDDPHIGLAPDCPYAPELLTTSPL
jgi:hypothetical protein